MRYIDGEGLLNEDAVGRVVPMYLTDDLRVIEAPCLWAMDVAQRRSRSDETLRVYTQALSRYLQWLDDNGHGAERWQFATGQHMDAFETYLRTSSGSAKSPPSDASIDYIKARVEEFYVWARAHGYIHKVALTAQFVTHAQEDGHLRGAIYHTSRKRDYPARHNDRRDQPTSQIANELMREIAKFIDDKTFAFACRVLRDDDPVYFWIALVLRFTALRPGIDLPQLPFRGEGPNAHLHPLEPQEIEALWVWDNEEKGEGHYRKIPFTFISKGGKVRTIGFPTELWVLLCKDWMPQRNRRARRYKEKHGDYPSNGILFLSEDGDLVTYRMLYDHFGRVADHPDFPSDRLPDFYPYMLRHAWATSLVYAYQKEHNWVGQFYDNAALEIVLKEYLGHENIKTTYAHYVHIVSLMTTGGDLIHDLLRSSDERLHGLVAHLGLTLPAPKGVERPRPAVAHLIA